MPAVRNLMLSLSLAAGLGLALPSQVRADGAVAVGLPADVAKEGVAFGWAINSATRQQAERDALGQCHAFLDAPKPTRDLCAVLRAFKDECIAIALDPEAGTPGVGWAVLPAKQAAEAKAMADCRATAGTAREGFCKVTTSRCDGNAR